MFNETSYNLAMGAGCSPQGAAIASAIAQAESGGNPRAHNPNGCDDSYGLWQINMVEGRAGCDRLGPARRAQFGLTSNSQLYDPATNARAMFAISGGCSNWRPWTTYTSGAYRQFMPASSPAGGSVPGGGGGGISSGGDNAGGGSTETETETITMPVDFFSGAPAWVPLAAIGVIVFLVMR